MIDATSAQALQEVVRRESRSLLHYVGDAFPWATVDRSEALDRLRDVVREEREGLAAVTQFLYRHHVVPLAGSYPVGFTSFNFVALDLILKRLVEHQEASLAELQGKLPAVTDAQARQVLQTYLDLKQRQLAALKGLQPGKEIAVMP